MKKIYFIIYFLILLATMLIIFFDFTFINTDKTIKIVSLLFSAVALAISLSLYDRYGLKKYIYEKKIKAVLEFVETIKKQRISFYIVNSDYKEFHSIEISSNMHNDAKKFEEYKTFPVLAYEDNINQHAIQFYDLITNIYMPKDISRYPIWPYLHQEINELPVNYIVVYFGDYENLIQNKKLIYLYSKDTTFNNIIYNYQNLMSDVKKWFRKNTNLENEIKI